jgi:putative SOS response-associated peptidase YedK
MCGRYSLHTHPEVVALYFQLGLVPEIAPRYNITPGTSVLIVRQDPAKGRLADLYRWGLIPSWAKDPAIGNKLANARAETVAEKPSFRSAFKRGRCLIPASGFYEWKKVAGRKQPYYVRPVGADLFALAGLTERWMSPEGPVYTCTIITTDANELMRDIHDRMPVIIAPEDHAAWLDPGNQATEKLKALLKPCPSERMAAHPVSPRVNTPKIDEPALIDPLESVA